MMTLGELQNHLHSKYHLKLKIDDINNIRKIVQDLKKLKELGINTRNYKSTYLNRYQSLIQNASDIGITIQDKLIERPSILVAKLYAIFEDLELTDRSRNILTESISLKRYRRPNLSEIESYRKKIITNNEDESIDWVNWTPTTKEEKEIIEMDFLEMERTKRDSITY